MLSRKPQLSALAAISQLNQRRSHQTEVHVYHDQYIFSEIPILRIVRTGHRIRFQFYRQAVDDDPAGAN